MGNLYRFWQEHSLVIWAELTRLGQHQVQITADVFLLTNHLLKVVAGKTRREKD